jgi:nucleotide-binding universal stress UspA family protein
MNSSIRQVLAHLDLSDTCADRLAVARDIAGRCGAALTAMYAVTPSFLEVPFAGQVGPVVAGAFEELDRQRREKVRTVFEEAMRRPGVVAEWSETREFPVMNAFIEQAMHADLLVLGQREPGRDSDDGLPPDFNEAAVIGSGRPASLVPYTGWKSTLGRTVAIAWKPSRESARAVSAALPLLCKAERVHVLAWDEPAPPSVSGHRLDLASWLHLHGVEAEFHREGGLPDALGDILLSRAFDLGADLLVMGCYGHSRVRELVLGGVTRTVFRSTTLPVLMAH